MVIWLSAVACPEFVHRRLGSPFSPLSLAIVGYGMDWTRVKAPVFGLTENSSRNTATDGELNKPPQTVRAAERVVQETPSPRLEQFVNKRAFAHASEPGT